VKVVQQMLRQTGGAFDVPSARAVLDPDRPVACEIDLFGHFVPSLVARSPPGDPGIGTRASLARAPVP
jgi:hypothetical protein